MPTFGLDALSSAAYGPEAALTVLLPLGAAGLFYILPITFAIVILLGKGGFGLIKNSREPTAQVEPKWRNICLFV